MTIFAIDKLTAIVMSITNQTGKILLVDDDKNITDLLSFNLSSEGFTVSIIPKAKDVKLTELAEYRLVIVDAMNQDFNGLQLSESIKAHPMAASVPVILCTQRDSEDVTIEAFEAGVEDVVGKPFSLRELMARIRAILRRHPVKAVNTAPVTEMVIPEMLMTIEPESQKVTVEDVVLPLTKTEYAILLFLVENRNSFFTRLDICREVWKEEETNNMRIVDTNISRLRKKLGENGKFIINRYGMGYAFVDKIAQ